MNSEKRQSITVAFSHQVPFYLAHGGCQTMIESIAKALREIGVNVIMESWWESSLKADVIHYFGRPSATNVRLAREKGYRVVFTDILDSVASRSRMTLVAQKWLIFALKKVLRGFAERFGWDSYRMVDAYVAIVPHEIETARLLFNVPEHRCHVIPHGLTKESLVSLAAPCSNGNYLFSLATIHSRKNTLALARLARRCNIPIVFAGKPYAEQDPYYQAFIKEVDDHFVRYAGFVSEEEKIRWMIGARGFVLMSEYESGCLAVYEAAAAGLPLLLADKAWARKSYPASPRIQYADIHNMPDAGTRLKTFYENAKRQPSSHTFPVHDWQYIAAEYAKIYETVLNEAC